MKITAWLVLIVSISFVSCQTRKAVIKNDYVLTLNQPAHIDASTTLTFMAVEDSRCPINTNCIWAGNAIATVKFSTNGLAETMKLCLGSCNTVTETNTFIFKEKTYLVKLTEVNPFPGTFTPNTNHKVTAKINISQQ